MSVAAVAKSLVLPGCQQELPTCLNSSLDEPDPGLTQVQQPNLRRGRSMSNARFDEKQIEVLPNSTVTTTNNTMVGASGDHSRTNVSRPYSNPTLQDHVPSSR